VSKSYYGLARNPFDKHSLLEKDAFPSSDHVETTSRLTYLKNIRGIGVFTSAPGYGKTYALRCFVKSLERNLHEVAYICLSTISILEFYRQFCYALGLAASHGKPAMFRAIQDRLYHLFKEKKKPFILIIDEAHELSAAILKDLKMIMNHDYDSTNCFTLVLAGEPHLKHILEKPVHEALRQRIAIHYSFVGLSDDETERYVLHKLGLAGAASSIIGDGIMPAIIGYAQGCPRLIDNLMNEVLLLGGQLEKPTIDTELVMAAVNNLALS
jgi:type II secretory pathway predicted ATPase ExeA